MFRFAFVLCVLSATSFAIPERLPPLWSTATPGSPSAEAIRVRAFADDAKIRVHFFFRKQTGKTNPPVRISLEGPLANHGDTGTVGAQTKTIGLWSGNRFESQLITLPKTGLYRLILTPDSPGGNFQYTLVPGPGATRPSMRLEEFLAKIPDSDIEGLIESFRPMLESIGQEPAWVARQVILLRGALQSRQFAGLSRFPTLPSPAEIVAGLQKLRTHVPTQPVAFSDRVYKGESLRDLIAKAVPDRAGVPPRAHPKLPAEIGYGHYPDQTVPTKYAAHSPVLAEALTSLASDNGSTLDLGTATARTPKDVFDWLLASGHRVRVLEEKSLANFLSLTYRGQPVQWTTWMNTGVQLSSGTEVKVPSSHSQTTFEISGPVVNARVSFFLGMFGVGFYAAIDERPSWTGFAREELADSTQDRNAVLKAVDLATSYHRMIREEQRTTAAGLPGGGYGYLGVCNDRAVIELALKGHVTTWPLLRPRNLTPPADTDPELVELLSRMPSDGAPTSTGMTATEYRVNAIHRLRQAVPANSLLFRDDIPFRNLMILLAEERVGRPPWQ